MSFYSFPSYLTTWTLSPLCETGLQNGEAEPLHDIIAVIASCLWIGIISLQFGVGRFLPTRSFFLPTPNCKLYDSSYGIKKNMDALNAGPPIRNSEFVPS